MSHLDHLIEAIPKAELHLHIEGTLEPEMMFQLASRNRVELPFSSVEETRAAYQFTNLQSFLDLYYQGAEVLRTAEDFYDLMAAYLHRAASDGVRRAEMFFDPQTHTHRGVAFGVFMEGFRQAMADAASLGLSTGLILCFLRHLEEDDALTTLDLAEPFLDDIIAVGLDSSETGHPPEKFTRAFARAKSMGLRTTAHAGEEGPAEYVWAALDVLGAERIDHGVQSEKDRSLLDRLADEGVPLTMCPLSNVRLRLFERLDDHNLARLLERGIRVTVNSDDPAYFGGYVGDNYRALARALGLGPDQIITLARNSIEAAFLPQTEKAALLVELEEAVYSSSDSPSSESASRSSTANSSSERRAPNDASHSAGFSGSPSSCA